MASASPGSRLQTGTALLAGARGVDTRLITARLKQFERVHKVYADAQARVEKAEAQLRAAQAVLSERDIDQDESVDALARALIADGESRTNPFASFGPLSPAAVMRLPFGDEARAIHQLVSAVRRTKKLPPATVRAAQAADKAAGALERALLPIAKLEGVLREARHTRDAIAQDWENALASVKRGARAAADEGAPRLYDTLFSRMSRPAKAASSRSTAGETQAPAASGDGAPPAQPTP